MNALAQRFSNTAFTISNESKAIVDLQTRFVSDQQLTVVASATLSELIYSHRERLQAALKSERALVEEARATAGNSNRFSEQKSSSLMDAADRNLALSRELTQTNRPATRSAEQILEEMSISVENLTAAANGVYGKSQDAFIPSGKK